jgi:hypothetical protein
MNRDTIERLLDEGKLQVLCGCQWYTARRNGKTKTWKTRPSDYRIPIKVGFKTCGHIDQRDATGGTVREKPVWNPALTNKANHAIERGA